MNRKEFIERLAGVSLILATGSESNAASPIETSQRHDVQGSPKGPAWRQGKRHVTQWETELPAPPEAVFPLLCPVREYEWLEGWASEMIYSESGVAEENCIFQTHFHGRTATWTVSRYEAPTRIEFIIVTPELEAARLNISLERTAAGTRLRWNRLFTGLSEKGNATIDSWKTSSDQALSEKLEYFIKTGKMKVGS